MHVKIGTFLSCWGVRSVPLLPPPQLRACDWNDVGRHRDKFVKTTVGSENHGEQQLTGMIQDPKKELAENRIEMQRLQKDQFSYWRGSGCVAGTPGEAAYGETGSVPRSPVCLICPLEQLRRQFRLRLSTCRRHHHPSVTVTLHCYRTVSSGCITGIKTTKNTNTHLSKAFQYAQNDQHWKVADSR